MEAQATWLLKGKRKLYEVEVILSKYCNETNFPEPFTFELNLFHETLKLVRKFLGHSGPATPSEPQRGFSKVHMSEIRF